jgi:hypothetical protein
MAKRPVKPATETAATETAPTETAPAKTAPAKTAPAETLAAETPAATKAAPKARPAKAATGADHGPLLARLADPADAGDLVDVIVDFVIDRPVSAYVDADRVLAAIDRALDARLTAKAIAEHVEPMIAREQARLMARPDEKVADWLTPEAKAELARLAALPVRVDEQVVRNFAEQPQVRDMLRSFVEDTLSRFISAFKPGGAGGGVAGAVGRSAFGFASKVSGGLMGGLGEQVEAQLKKAATGFVQTSMPAMVERMISQITAPETAKRMAQTQSMAFEGALKLPVSRIARIWAKVDTHDLMLTLPGLIAHNLARPEIRAGIRAEVAAMLAVVGAEPVRALLADEAQVAAIKADARAIGLPLLAEGTLHGPILAWLARG